MNGADVFFLLLWFAAIIVVAVAAFIYGWAYRDEHPPHPAMRTVAAAVLEDRPRVALWLEGPWRVSVQPWDLPHFLCRGECLHFEDER